MPGPKKPSSGAGGRGPGSKGPGTGGRGGAGSGPGGSGPGGSGPGAPGSRGPGRGPTSRGPGNAGRDAVPRPATDRPAYRPEAERHRDDRFLGDRFLGDRFLGDRPQPAGKPAGRSAAHRAKGDWVTGAKISGERTKPGRPGAPADRAQPERAKPERAKTDRPRAERWYAAPAARTEAKAGTKERQASDRPARALPPRDRPGRDAPRTTAPAESSRRGAGRKLPATARVPTAVATYAPQSADSREGNRIAKLLARAGVASRREIERMIEEGRVALNGEVLTTPATVLKSLNGVTVDGVAVAEPEPTRLFRYHKPTGLLTAERDPKGRLTIYDRLPAELPRVMPVGRLDLNTEGLLLLTTDGELKRQMELPSTGVERSYRARTYGEISQAQLEDLFEGIEVEGVRYGRIDANLERRTGRNQWIEMTLTEGKNREVRRVLEHLGLQVSRLIRTRYGPFLLEDMPVGAVDEVRQHDLFAFRKSLK